MTNGVLM